MPSSQGDELIAPESVFQPDERNTALGHSSIDIQYQLIEPYSLTEAVPESIATQYEVARNLYLYAFYVYRFYMKAQQQALVALEYAIKKRFESEELRSYERKIGMRPGLAACLRYVFDNSYLHNEDFPTWHSRNQREAEHDYRIMKIEEMKSKGLEEIELDYSEINLEGYSVELDYLAVLLKRLPRYRNQHAHGSTMLHNHVLLTFQDVSIIINKIYESRDG